MPNILIEDFHNNFSVVVSRYELYPLEEPFCYCVGFIVKYKEISKYVDTQITLSQTINKTTEEIVKLGWINVRENILNWATTVYNKPSIIGSVINPTNLTFELE